MWGPFVTFFSSREGRLFYHVRAFFCYVLPLIYGGPFSPGGGLLCYVFPLMRGPFYHVFLLLFSLCWGFFARFFYSGEFFSPWVGLYCYVFPLMGGLNFCYFFYYRGPFLGSPPFPTKMFEGAHAYALCVFSYHEYTVTSNFLKYV